MNGGLKLTAFNCPPQTDISNIPISKQHTHTPTPRYFLSHAAFEVPLCVLPACSIIDKNASVTFTSLREISTQPIKTDFRITNHAT